MGCDDAFALFMCVPPVGEEVFQEPVHAQWLQRVRRGLQPLRYSAVGIVGVTTSTPLVFFVSNVDVWILFVRILSRSELQPSSSPVVVGIPSDYNLQPLRSVAVIIFSG